MQKDRINVILPAGIDVDVLSIRLKLKLFFLFSLLTVSNVNLQVYDTFL